MPPLIQPLTNLIPLTFALEVLRGAFVKGSGFAALAPQLLVLAGFAAVIFTASIIATRRRIAE
jgi:ABC-2 type transport system permease protein